MIGFSSFSLSNSPFLQEADIALVLCHMCTHNHKGSIITYDDYDSRIRSKHMEKYCPFSCQSTLQFDKLFTYTKCQSSLSILTSLNPYYFHSNQCQVQSDCERQFHIGVGWEIYYPVDGVILSFLCYLFLQSNIPLRGVDIGGDTFMYVYPKDTTNMSTLAKSYFVLEMRDVDWLDIVSQYIFNTRSPLFYIYIHK